MAEVSPEEQEVEDVVERYPESNPQDVGLRTVPSGPGDPLQGLLILLKGNPSCQSQSQSLNSISVSTEVDELLNIPLTNFVSSTNKIAIKR